jgi:Icc-related predicted phosphoesterase
LRIFSVSDIHGSVTCFRTLVNAGKFYGADLLVMGGDPAGKQLIPVVARGGVSRAHDSGADFTAETTQEIADFERRVAGLGAYTLRTDPEFAEQLAADGGGWLRQRLGGGGAPPPPPLRATSPLAANGAWFR